MAAILNINLKKIAHNVSFISSKIKEFNNGKIFGVTKVVCGDPEIAKVFIENGYYGLAESRLENVVRIKESSFYKEFVKDGKKIEFLNLRIPAFSEIPDLINLTDCSLVSEYETIKKIDEICSKINKKYNIIIMIDLGDLREGIIPKEAKSLEKKLWENEVYDFFSKIINFKNINIVGIGTNLACYGGIAPSVENMKLLVSLKNFIEKNFNLDLKYISGANSSGIPLLLEGGMPKEVNHFRIGETGLLGVNVLNRESIKGMFQDAFILRAEIIELKEKPSVPIGNKGQNAFGEIVHFEDKGIQLRGILSIGKQDVVIENLKPVDNKISILGASSDHLEIDLTNRKDNYKLGDFVEFIPGYSALLALSTSKYVKKNYI
jgi:predicted amino acid racemase